MPRPAAYVDEPGAPQVGVWDQWTVLNDRPYSKEGDQSLHDEAACRRFLENFRAQQNDLPCNIDHRKGDVVGWYNAMALFVGGRLMDIADHAPGQYPDPTVDDLPPGDNGSPPNDGIYWRRAKLTGLGLESKQFLRKVSPEFYMNGKNEHEEDVGPLAVGGAWTNYPFLDGCELNEFTKEPKMAKSYAARCYEEAGIKDDPKDESRFSKMRMYLRGKHGAGYSKFEEAAGVGKDDDDMQAMSKMMPFMAGKFGDHAEPDGDEASVQAGGNKPEQMTGPSVSDGAPAVVDGGEANDDEVAGGGHQMTRSQAFAEFARDLGLPSDPRAAREKVKTFQAAAAALPGLNQQVQALGRDNAERRAKEMHAEAQEFVREAWRRGQIQPRASETHAQAQGRILSLYTKSGRATAEAALLDPGSYATPEQVAGAMQFTRDRPVQEAARPDDEILRRAKERMAADGIEDPDGKKREGRWDHRLSQYARAVCQEDQGLARRYSGQSKAALFEGAF